MEIIEFLSENWLILLMLLAIGYVYYKFKNKSKIGDLSFKEMKLAIEIGVYILIVYYVDVYIFTEHNYFTLAIFPFVPVFALFIHYLLSGSDILILESTLKNEEWHDLDSTAPIISENTGQRALIMSREVYDSKKWIGNNQNPLWRGSDRIKFCDYYSDKTGVFFTHEIESLKNINFYQCKSFWLLLKRDIPKLQRENIKLTWLSDYKLANEQNILKDNTKLSITALKNQYEHEPFSMPDDIDKIREAIEKERHRALAKSEEPQAPAPEEAKAPAPEEAK